MPQIIPQQQMMLQQLRPRSTPASAPADCGSCCRGRHTGSAACGRLLCRWQLTCIQQAAPGACSRAMRLRPAPPEQQEVSRDVQRLQTRVHMSAAAALMGAASRRHQRPGLL